MVQVRVSTVALTVSLSLLAAVSALGVVGAAPAAHAQTSAPGSAHRWTLRLVAGWMDTDAGFTSEEPAEDLRVRVSVAGAPALGLSVERMLGARMGVDLGILAGRLPATFRVAKPAGTFSDRDDLDVVPIFAALNWHPRRSGGETRLDPWLGAGAAYVHFGDVRFFASEGANGEDDVGWLAQAGVDLRLGTDRPLDLTLSAVWIDADFAGQEQDEPDRGRVALDTLTLRAGVAARFGREGR